MSAQVGEDAKFLLAGLLGCTLPMISKDFESFPDHRLNFFKFLKAGVKNCFQYLISIDPPQFKLVINSFIWSIKHSLSTMSEVGLETIQNLLDVSF